MYIDDTLMKLRAHFFLLIIYSNAKQRKIGSIPSPFQITNIRFPNFRIFIIWVLFSKANIREMASLPPLPKL